MIGLHLPLGTKLKVIKDTSTIHGHKLLRVGEVYTLRDYVSGGGITGVRLVEVLNDLSKTFAGVEKAYLRKSFRVVQHPKLPAEILECLNARPKRVNKRERETA